MGSLIDRAPQVRKPIVIIRAVTVQRLLKQQRKRKKVVSFSFAALCVVIMLRFILIHNRQSNDHISNMSCTDLLCHYHKGGHWAIMLGNCLTADVHLSANFLPWWSAFLLPYCIQRGQQQVPCLPIFARWARLHSLLLWEGLFVPMCHMMVEKQEIRHIK